MTIGTITGVLRKRAVRTSLGSIAILWFLFALLFYAFYEAAYSHLQTNNPSQMQNRSELQVFYAPLTLRIGDEFTARDLTDYFSEIGYDSSGSETPGSYAISKTAMSFIPRSAAFPAGEISIEKNKVNKITIENKVADSVEIEPLPMRSFIKYVNVDSLREQRVRRIVLSPDAIPQVLKDAATSAEDTRFYSHFGVDVFGIAKRLVTLRGGGSSITQQLIKNNVIKGSSEEFWQTYLGFFPETMQRKVMEIPFALAAEEILNKDEIMAGYLSMVPMAASEGVELHGVISASQEYFGKSVSELTLSESAMLAGMIHKPSFYVNLARQNNYQELVGRRNRILDAVQKNHPERYSGETIESAKRESLKFVFASANRAERPADAYSRLFSGFVANHIPENLSEIRETEGNLQVFTTLDYPTQKTATEISEKANLEITSKVMAECLRQKPVNIDCSTVTPQVALVAMDAEAGEILAMYGGNTLNVNFALTKRSPASAIKPFYYAQALENGIWNGKPFMPETVIDPNIDSVSFRPLNNVGKKSTAAVGFAKSYNFHAVAAAESVGLKKAVEMVGKLTNSSPEISGMSAIGGSKGSEASLLDMVSAYSIFANQGIFTEATPYKFYSQNNKKSTFPKLKPERLFSTKSATETNEMMRGVLSEIGTAPNFKRDANLPNDFDISSKTGTGMVADLWFFAVTPKLIVGVWVGLPTNEINLDMEYGFTGGKIAAPIAAKFFRNLEKSNSNLPEEK